MAKKKSSSSKPAAKKAPKPKAKVDPEMSLFSSWVEDGYLHLQVRMPNMDRNGMIVRVDADLEILEELSESVEECCSIIREEEAR